MVNQKDALQKPERLRYSVNLIQQGKHQFYSVTMFSDVLARTCKVTTRKEDPIKGFQRSLDKKRAQEIADYIDNGWGSIPNSIVLSAQSEAELSVVGRSKTLEFNNVPGAFLILDGQHRVYGFQSVKTRIRVPVIIYNGLSRTEETRLFIDINTKQRPVPSSLLLDIKQLADSETNEEIKLRSLFDLFHNTPNSALKGMTSPAESGINRITRVTFNQSIKPFLGLFTDREVDEIYPIINSYLIGISDEISEKNIDTSLSKPVIFRAFLSFFPSVAQKVNDRYNGNYSVSSFSDVIRPVFENIPKSKFSNVGPSWSNLAKYLEDRLKKKQTL
jgi:DGQHR domain-containing protein